MSSHRKKWKLIHKETGLTYNQWSAKHTPLDTSFAVLLENGTPAIYFNEKYYPWIQFLSLSEWSVEFKDQKSNMEQIDG